MRWIAASLLIANILTFVYLQLFAEKPAVAHTPQLASQVSAPRSVVLLSELVAGSGNSEVAPVEALRIESNPLANSTSPVRPLASGPLCTIVGRFEKLLEAEYFLEQLTALGLSAEIKNIIVASESGYWLHLPPEASRKEALRRLSELQRRGIDSYVIPSGNLENGISLGMFSQKTRAETMRAKIASQGYEPQVTPVPREQKEIWLYLPQGEATKLSAERWAELLSSEDYLQKRQNLCSDIAST